MLKSSVIYVYIIYAFTYTVYTVTDIQYNCFHFREGPCTKSEPCVN